MKNPLSVWLRCRILLLVPLAAHAQVNSGSNGSDGAFNPTTNTVINMADHPDGIYQYTSVNIPAGVTVSFVPNAANTPVVWLVQSNCAITGTVDVSGMPIVVGQGSAGGPGGFRGGSAGSQPTTFAGDGLGPGGGTGGVYTNRQFGGGGSYATVGSATGNYSTNSGGMPAGLVYGNSYCLPLIGGSGGGGGAAAGSWGGVGGGGAILIAANQTIALSGSIKASGGGTTNCIDAAGGAGSGGAVRLVAQTVSGAGQINAAGGTCTLCYPGFGGYGNSIGGNGRVRIDAPQNIFTGYVSGDVTSGFQPIIIPPPNQAVSLAIQSVAGIAVPQSPTGASVTPDAIVPGQQANPVSIVVRCVNIPLNTAIIVEIKPANGATIRTVGVNNTGTQASSTATISLTMPRGAGTVQAKCVSGIAGSLGASLNNGEKFKNYAQTGLTADGEVFAQMEITGTLGRGQEIAYITESGKRFVLPRN